MNTPTSPPTRPHIDADGRFQSDKYPTCPAGKVPLSVKDKSAQDLLWEYAQRRRGVDAEFADDLEFALTGAGYKAAPGDEEAAVYLPEHPDERRMFDNAVRLCGSPLKAIAQALTMWSTSNPAHGSLSMTQAIYSNEIAKADRALTTERASRIAAEAARDKAVAEAAVLFDALHQAAVKFREYQKLHLAKSPPDITKANANAWQAHHAEKVLAERAPLASAHMAEHEALKLRQIPEGCVAVCAACYRTLDKECTDAVCALDGRKAREPGPSDHYREGLSPRSRNSFNP